MDHGELDILVHGESLWVIWSLCSRVTSVRAFLAFRGLTGVGDASAPAAAAGSLLACVVRAGALGLVGWISFTR